MKTITFRPLRRIKKTGKITVASYMAWRNVKTSDYSQFALIINDEYKQFSDNEFVYNHEGKQLFWRDFDPASIPVFNYSPVEEFFNVTEIHETNERHAIYWGGEYGLNYCSSEMDCDGVPTFSHHTIDYVVENYFHHEDKINQHEPLTVGIVKKWFGWFLYQLEKSELQIGIQ